MQSRSASVLLALGIAWCVALLVQFVPAAGKLTAATINAGAEWENRFGRLEERVQAFHEKRILKPAECASAKAEAAARRAEARLAETQRRIEETRVRMEQNWQRKQRRLERLVL